MWEKEKGEKMRMNIILLKQGKEYYKDYFTTFLTESCLHGWIIDFKFGVLNSLILTRNLMVDFTFIIMEDNENRWVLNLMFYFFMAPILGVK